MKDQILKIAKVKSEKEFYKKYPSEEAFMKAHGKAFKKAAMGRKMVNDQLHQLTDFGNPPIAQAGATTPPEFKFTKPKSFGSAAETAGMSALNNLDKIAGGISAIGEQKKNIKKADQSAQLSGLSLQASQTMEKPKNQYVRPEDALVQPGQLGNPYGSGTNYLAAENGTMIGGNPTEIQNMYNPGDMYDDLGYEPLNDSNVKQFAHGGDLPKAEFGEYFQDSGQAQIGSAVGESIGSAFGPAGAAVGKFLGKVAGNALGGAKDARALQAQKDKTALAQSQMGFEQARSQGPLNSFMKEGGSVVNYMKDKGMNSSFESRKKLYKNIFGESFNGKAYQNLKLLNALSSDVKDSSFQKPSTASSKKETPTKKQTVKDTIVAQNVTTPFTNPNYPTAPVQRGLESGVIVDKNTNEAYVIKGNKVVKQFPVLTGQSRDGENRNNKGVNYLEDHPENRVTPTGTYNMRPKKDIYGEPGFALDAIPAFGYPAAEARNIAAHVTYPGDFAKRNPMYSLPGEERTASYGCVNCKKPDINSLTNQYFPQGDTTMVIDSRNQMDKNIISNLKQYEDGGWMNPEYNPQMIAKFGDYDVKDLLKPPHDADMLRRGGHLAQVGYTAPSAEAMYTGRAQNRSVLDSDIRSKMDMQSITNNGRYNENLRSAVSSTDRYADGRPVEKTDMYSMTRGQGDNQRVKEFLRSQTGNAAPQYSMQKSYKPLFSDQYKTVSREIGAGRGDRRMADMEQFLNEGKMKHGGQMAMGGDLQVAGGEAETISYNPFLPDGGETVMFNGPSHDNGGIDVKYGQNGVEVEGGEPAVKLQDGGSDGSLVVFGNIKINKEIADLMGDPKAKGKKFKTYIADVAKNDAKQLKRIDKGLELIENANENSAYDHLTLNTGKAIMQGAKAWQKINADKIKEAGIVQDSIHKTARQLGVKSDKLAEGKLEKEKDPSMIAQKGIITPFTRKNTMTNAFIEGNRSKTPPAKSAASSSSKGKGKAKSDDSVELRRLDVENMPNIIPASRNLTPSQLVNLPKGFAERAMASAERVSPAIDSENSKGNFWNKAGGIGLAALSNLENFLRPSNANEDLPPDQLYPEYFALANNQLDPVQAQTYQPMLDQPYDISLQDQINAVDAQANAAIRASGQNPAAQAYIMAQAIEAKNKIKGGEFRANQANKAQTYQANRAAINDASLKNLGIYDQQYTRQSQAKSNTKAQTIEALKSISSKVAQNKLENRQLGVMENMYGFRFDSQGRAYNTNNLAQFNPYGNPFARTNNASGQLEEGYEDLFNTAGRRVATRKSGKNETSRNGSIVKALKSL